jgi:hypothetical protein
MPKLKKIVVFLMSLFLAMVIFMQPLTVYAYVHGEEGVSAEELVKDPKYWLQGYVPATGSETITLKEGSDTIGDGACSHFAMSYALVKMGILNPKNGDTPLTHIKKAREKNCFSVNWGYFDFSRVDELYPDVTFEGRDYNVQGMSAADGLTYVKGKMAEGYYVVGIVYGSVSRNGHCIFFDGVNSDGKMSIGDSGYLGLTFEDVYMQSTNYFNYLELLKCKGKDVNSQPSIYDDTVIRGVSTREIVEYNHLVEEYDLTGMPTKSNLTKDIVRPRINVENNLTENEKLALASIKETRDSNKLDWFQIAKNVISFLGFILLIYDLFLLLCYVFDRVNSFINVSLVNTITLGHIKVAPKDDFAELSKGDKNDKGYVTLAKLIVIILVIGILGGLMISGTLSYWIYLLIQGVNGV